MKKEKINVDQETGEVVEFVDHIDNRSRLRHTLRYRREIGEINDEPSCTVPDQSLSIREIMQRFASGRPLTVANNLMYTGDDYTPDVRSMDLVELEEMRRENAERINEMEKELADIKKSKQDAETKKRLREEIQADLKKSSVKQLDIEDAIEIAKSSDNEKK